MFELVDLDFSNVALKTVENQKSASLYSDNFACVCGSLVYLCNWFENPKKKFSSIALNSCFGF